MKIRKFLKGMLTVAAIALPVAASAYEIRVGYTQDALTLDPANHRNRLTEGIIRNMYDGLTIRDDQMKVWLKLSSLEKL